MNKDQQWQEEEEEEEEEEGGRSAEKAERGAMECGETLRHFERL